MVGVKILIDVKEYERLKKCEDVCKKTHQSSTNEQPNEQIAEQSGSGLEEDERFRKICRDELKKLSGNSDKELPDTNLVTPQPEYIPPITIPNPRDSAQVQYEKVLPKDLNDDGGGYVESEQAEANDDPWYYIGPLSQ